MTLWADMLEMWDIVYNGCVDLFQAMMASYDVPIIGEVSILGLVFGGGIAVFVTTAIVRSFLS